jgi:hypothetical protein
MNWDSAIALLGSGAAVVASAVAVMTYRRQFAERPVAPEPERTMVLAGHRSDYAFRPAPPPPSRSPRTVVRRNSARLTLVMFLLGLAGAAAAVAISRPKGYTWVALPLVGLSDLITIVASIRLIMLLRRQWKARGLSGPTRAGNGFLVVILTVAVLIGLGGAWTLVYIDYLSRVDNCVAGGWIVDSHVMRTTPFLTGKGAHLNLTADGDGVLGANNLEYTATADGHRFRAVETFTMTFVFAAHGGHLWVDDFQRQDTEKATIDGKAWEPLNGPDFAGILNSFGGYLDFTCSGSQLMISDIGTVLITAHRGI